jgi:hypothetical protein
VIERRLIRLGPGKSGKKGMMDVDDSFRKTRDKLRRQNLHRASQYNQAYLVTFQQLHLPLFDIQPVLGRFREMMKRNAVERSELLRFPMMAIAIMLSGFGCCNAVILAGRARLLRHGQERIVFQERG